MSNLHNKQMDTIRKHLQYNREQPNYYKSDNIIPPLPPPPTPAFNSYQSFHHPPPPPPPTPAFNSYQSFHPPPPPAFNSYQSFYLPPPPDKSLPSLQPLLSHLPPSQSKDMIHTDREREFRERKDSRRDRDRSRSGDRDRRERYRSRSRDRDRRERYRSRSRDRDLRERDRSRSRDRYLRDRDRRDRDRSKSRDRDRRDKDDDRRRYTSTDISSGRISPELPNELYNNHIIVVKKPKSQIINGINNYEIICNKMPDCIDHKNKVCMFMHTDQINMCFEKINTTTEQDAINLAKKFMDNARCNYYNPQCRGSPFHKKNSS